MKFCTDIKAIEMNKVVLIKGNLYRFTGALPITGDNGIRMCTEGSTKDRLNMVSLQTGYTMNANLRIDDERYIDVTDQYCLSEVKK